MINEFLVTCLILQVAIRFVCFNPVMKSASERSLPLSRVVFLLLVMCGVTSISWAQFETAAVLGRVVDPSAAPVAKAQVGLLNLDTGVVQTDATDGTGSYQFLEVPVGRYRVTITAPQFQTAESADFRVDAGQRQRVDMFLRIGDATQTVEVEAAASPLETEMSDRGEVINHEEIVELPLNGRSSASLALLAPGVRLAYGLPKRESSFNVNGLRSQFNNFVLDGLDNNAYGTSNQGLSNQVIQVSPDALQEFRVITDNYSAEYGHVGGAVINAVLKSGTNQVHGVVCGVPDGNTDLNAVGYFKPVGGQKPVYIQNQFGAAVGGPIRKDKMFLFGDFEGWRAAATRVDLRQCPNLGAAVRHFRNSGGEPVHAPDPTRTARFRTRPSPASAGPSLPNSRRRTSRAIPRTTRRFCRQPMTITRVISGTTTICPTGSPSLNALVTIITTS